MMRGERRARWFLREWQAIGGRFTFMNAGTGKMEMALDGSGIDRARLDKEDPEWVWLAMFEAGYPGCYRTAAKIVKAESLDTPVRSQLAIAGEGA